MHSSSAKSQFLWWHPVPWFTLPHSMELHRHAPGRPQFEISTFPLWIFRSSFFDFWGDSSPNPINSSFVWFSSICSWREGSTAAAVTLDAAVDKSREKMADRVARSPARLCSRDGYHRRLEYDFLAFCLGFFFSFFFSVLIPVCFSSSRCFVRAAATWILFSKY